MTESATPKPFFTRRREIAGAVGVLVIVGVAAAVSEAFRTDERKELAIKFDRFENEFGRPNFAFVTLSNCSSKDLVAVYAGLDDRSALKSLPESAENFVGWYHDDIRIGPNHSYLEPGKSITGMIPLRHDGQVRTVAVYYHREPLKPSRLVLITRNLSGWFSDPRPKPKWAISAVTIQCPKKLPDGTVEPPRLVSAPGAKP